MASIILLINMVLSIFVNQGATVQRLDAQTYSVSGTLSSGAKGSISVSNGRINPIILGGEYE